MVNLVRDLRKRKKIEVISPLNDVIHSKVAGIFSAILKQVMEEFSATAVSFSIPLNETSTDRSEGSRLLVSIYYVHTMSSKKQKHIYFKNPFWTSLVAQWFRNLLSMQGAQVRSLVGEDPTCRGDTKSVHHNY